MSCCHHYLLQDGCESAFTVDTSMITFGRGCLSEAGPRASSLGLKQVAIFTDTTLAALPYLQTIKDSLTQAGISFTLYDEVSIEPTDSAFRQAAQFATEANADGYISLGGGSVIDTCKAANLYASYPADFDAYVNAPVGDGKPVPGPLKPHIACPTTTGTGSEVTGIAIFDYESLHAKTGIAHKHLRPTQALIDPDVTHSLPSGVVAASGFDVLSHALESYTAMPYTQRERLSDPSQRPMSQGANPWSDVGCREALRLSGKYLLRAVNDADDDEAREGLMWAATLAGIAFGNAGVHLPHGMAYAVAGGAHSYHHEGYPHDHALVPHGVSVIVNAPAVFRWTAESSPERHLESAELLGAAMSGADLEDAGEVLATHLQTLMQACCIPNGIKAIGYSDNDISTLTAGTLPQQRLLKNSPRLADQDALNHLFSHALSYW